MTLAELVKHKHPYYGSGEEELTYETFQEFVDEMKDYDIDLNLCYRWDVKEHEENKKGTYYAELFTLLQRKGRITAHRIEAFVESDIPLLQEYLKPHMEKLKRIWIPFQF